LTPELPAEIGAEEGARLHVARRIVDFGEIWQGAVRQVTFPIISAGTEPLHIKRVNASCGCTVVESRIVANDGSSRELVYDEPLPPGTRVEIVARFDSRTRDGYEKKTIEIYSDDPQGGHSLELGVTTKAWLVVEEDPLVFGRLFPGEPVSKSTTITSSTGEAFGLTWRPKRALPSGVSIALAPNDEGALRSRSWTLTTTLEPGVPLGPLMVPVMLETDVHLPDIGAVTDEGDVKVAQKNSTREDAPSLDAAHADDHTMDNTRPENHFFDQWTSATILAPIAPDFTYVSLGFLRPEGATSASSRIECFDPQIAENFLLGTPTVTLTDSEGGELKNASAFTPTLRRITPENEIESSPSRPLLPGSSGAWDLELSVMGFSGEGENSLVGRIEIAFPDAPEPIDPIFLFFQVILQP
jgi:hypothetical protein